jgi:phosphoribosylformimino-5-aminoimidazole carboxamide ribotide isomerase
MILYPAVDILGGKAVRLSRGDFDHQTVYGTDPLDPAQRWVADGARALHVVDLDGARSGTPANLEQVARIAAAVEVPVQVGGGLRSLGAVERALEAGAARVVLGTAALTDVDFLDEVIAHYGDHVVVSIDGRGGRVATSGWTEQTEIPVQAVFERLRDRGVRRFIYSSIDRDGMLEGPDLVAAQQIAEAVKGSFIYSGGVSSLDDLRALAGLRQVNLAGVIVGTALYEQRFGVQEAQRVLDARG